MVFCTASMMQRNDTMWRKGVSIPDPRNLVLHNTFVTSSLHSASTKAREEAPVKKREEVKHFPCISFLSHRKAHWMSMRYSPFIVRNVKQVLVTLSAGDRKEHLRLNCWYINYLWVFATFGRAIRAVKTDEILPYEKPKPSSFSYAAILSLLFASAGYVWLLLNPLHLGDEHDFSWTDKGHIWKQTSF